MKVLVVDRDEVTTQMLKSKLEALGHNVIVEPSKNDAVVRLKQDPISVIFIDPAPVSNTKLVVSTIRRSTPKYSYVVLMSKDIDSETSVNAGANDLLSKPVDSTILQDYLENAERLMNLTEHLGDEGEDFPSAGGVIAKSAFNQLYLSALERADRYAEKTSLLFIRIDNYDDLVNMDGRQAAAYSSAKLSQYLVRIRRQSDIIAQTGKNEYCLMLQRPRYDSEPLEAAKRFGEFLGKLEGITESDLSEVDLSVRLVDIATGRRRAHYELTLTKDGPKQTAQNLVGDGGDTSADESADNNDDMSGADIF